MRNVLLTTILLLFVSSLAISQTSLEGKVTNAASGETLPFATIKLLKNEVFMTGTDTDLDGNYSLAGLEPGTYEVEASYVGFTPQKQVGVVVKGGKSNRLDFQITEGVLAQTIEIVDYKVPLIEQDNTTSGKTVTAESIRALPTRSVAGIAATSAGLSATEGGAISVRGSRTDATYYYIDGVRVSSAAMIPTSEIEQMQVITGGIEAQYGDVTGGIISVTSKGPSQRFSGGIEVESSELLDAYGSNLFSANVSGPIMKNSEGRSIVGFRLAGQYRKVDDNSPSAFGVYRLSEDKIAALETNPVTRINNSLFPTAELLTNDDIPSTLDARPNDDLTQIDLTGKLDARLSDNIDITLSGSYDDNQNRFTPSGAWSLLNWTNNPYNYTKGYRGNFRFRHKLGKQGYGGALTDEEKAQKNTSLRNAHYSLQLGYQKRFSNREDFRHEDNLFRYGYYGKTERSWMPIAAPVQDPTSWGGMPVLDINGVAWDHQADLRADADEGFQADESINAVLARYNMNNGDPTDDLNTAWGLYSNVGQVYNTFQKGESDRYTFNITSGFEFLPGGSENGKHNIQLGVTYEQRLQRLYFVAPERLWVAGRLLANSHIAGIDTTDAIGTFTQDIPGFPDAEFMQYQTLVDMQNYGGFNQRVREAFNLSVNDYINIDEIHPDDLSLDLFDASELTDQGLIVYFGYDYLGNKIGAGTKFEDFFSDTLANGNKLFTVAPLQPIYGAAYLQDKFTYKDIIFRVGLRLDYYDANTKVLKDPYALYEIETASGHAQRTGQTMSESIGDDYKVYVADPESDQVVGYRQGDQWFLPNGTAVSSGDLLFEGLVYPSYVGRDQGRELNIRADGFEVNSSFDDYDPQLNWMPRLAFSFPISEDANFFTHYDILVQRPPSATAATALSYYYFEDPNRTPANNPNLKPEKTIDFEVGFQQKLSNSSALKMSLYYKELRDMIQRRVYRNVAVPVNQYESTSNIDFGTVKGFSLGYDRRRTGNLLFNATYTLQFADGTGSDVNSSTGINSRGNIRTLLPLSFDERHRFTGTIDYRYSEGKRYNGPRIAGFDIFANTGVNFIATAVSGRPYTRRLIPTVLGGSGYVGSINGARLPWQFDLDLKLDKRFKLNLGGEGSRPLHANVYIRVENLLDTKNVIGVYGASGDPDDDGFIVSANGQEQLAATQASGKDPLLYLTSYQWRVLNPGNYTLPRRIFLGAIFDF